MLGRLFGRRKSAEQLEVEAEAWNREKEQMLKGVLGKEHDRVMHAIIPFAVGGGLDLYYYPNLPKELGGRGTAVATKELVETRGRGPSNRVYKAYELAMATRLPLDLDKVKDADTEFGAVHARINGVLNAIARYAPEAKLNPNETMEFPDDEDFGALAGRCLILDALAEPSVAKRVGCGLMLIMEIHRSEMQFAMQGQQGAELLARLKKAGHYPFSDLTRDAVA